MSRDRDAPEGASVHRRTTILILMTTAAFLTPFMSSSVVVALPLIGKEMRLSAVTLGWVGTAYLLAAAVFLIPMGRLADLIGRRKVFLWGIGLFTLSTLAIAFAPDPAVLLTLRALQGLSGSMAFATGLPILISVFPLEERGRALGINVAGVYLGLSLGPMVGGFLTQHLGWRAVFLAGVPVGLITLILARRHLRREWAEAGGERFDLTGAVLLCAGLSLMMVGLTRLPSIWGAVLAAGGLAALLVFGAWEMRCPNPMLDLRLFRDNPVFAFSNLAALANYCATSAVGFLLSLYLQYIKGLSPEAAGIVLVAQPVLMTLFSPLAGRLSDRVEPRILASAGMTLTTVGLCILITLRPATPLPGIVGSLMLLGLSFALFSSPNTNAVMSSVEKRYYGVASGTLGTMRLTGQMLSMGIATLLFALYLGQAPIVPEVYPRFLLSVRTAFIVFAALCFAGIFASLARGKVRGGPPAS